MRYETASHAFSVTQPYVEIRSERAAVITDGAVVVRGARTRQRVSGMGDLVATYTYKAAAWPSGWYADYTARVKFGTADADEGLGTGRNDYTFLAYFARDHGRFTPSVEIGYRFRGQPAGLELNDTASVSLGALYRLEGPSRVEAYYDYRQAAAPGAQPQRELGVYYAYRPSRRLRFDVYLLKGFSDDSPDRGAGARVALYF